LVIMALIAMYDVGLAAPSVDEIIQETYSIPKSLQDGDADKDGASNFNAATRTHAAARLVEEFAQDSDDELPCLRNPQDIDHMDDTSTDCVNTPSGGACGIVCKKGRVADKAATCKDGSWDDKPDCKEPKCTTNPPGVDGMDPANTDCQGTDSGGTCDIACNPGFKPSEAATCHQGSWSVVTCDSDSIPGDLCKINPSDVDNMDDDATSCVGTESGESCPIVCQPGYTASGVATCKDGSWDDVPDCDKNDDDDDDDGKACSHNPDIDNIDPEYTSCQGTVSGTTCDIQCTAGYAASGTALCRNGDWQVKPRCNDITGGDGDMYGDDDD